ncbi:MAG: hypothetical protein IJ834_01905 [Paludibacteraceae bacterium]|nr:hypothetical protein [Paludibacteraceae bacterium]
MKSKLSLLALFLLLSAFVLTHSADNAGAEIELYEIVNGSNLIGDNPLDSPGEMGYEPTHPNQFHATINGRMLDVVVDNNHINNILVRDNVDNVVVNQQFVGHNNTMLSSAGNYTIVIYNTTLTLIGHFYAE